MDPMSATGGVGLTGILLIAAGVVGIVTGFAWLRRITSSDDDGPSSWRSHR